VQLQRQPTLPFDSASINTQYPSQNTFSFPNGIEISSEFDSGNLAKCYPDETKPNTYICWLAGDGQPY